MELFFGLLFVIGLPVTVLLCVAWATGLIGVDIIKGWTGKLSLPAQNILKEYMALPESSRPFHDIMPALEAMDARHDRRGANGHFKDYASSKFTWTEASSCNDFCVHTDTFRKYASVKPKCPYQEYVTLHENIAAVHEELEIQKRKAIETSTQAGYDILNDLNKALNQERKIINSVTKEFL